MKNWKLKNTYNILFETIEAIDSIKPSSIYYVDESTGESYKVAEEHSKDIIDYIKRVHKNYEALSFIKIYQQQEEHIARDLTGAAIKVLSLIRARLSYNNSAYGLNNKEIADILKMSIRTVSRALKELEDYGVLQVIGKKHNRKFRINPANTLKGKLNNNKDSVRKFKRR